MLKKIGIVGGMAWQTTVAYYADLCRRSQERSRICEISIESLALVRAVGYFGADGDEASWARFDAYHRSALRRLEAAGAEIAVIASNTPHHRFAQIIDGIGIPVVSIIDAAAERCVREGVDRVLLLGTAHTMQSRVFRDGFTKYGIDAYAPRDVEVREQTIALIHDLQHERTIGASERLAGIVARAVGTNIRRPVVCLACTELSLAFASASAEETFERGGVTYINTGVVHVAAVFERALWEG